MSNVSQMEKDAERLKYLHTRINEEYRNVDIAKEALQIAERYRRKADNQRMALAQLQKEQNNEHD